MMTMNTADMDIAVDIVTIPVKLYPALAPAIEDIMAVIDKICFAE